MGSSIPSTSRSPPTYKGNTIFVHERKTKLAKEDNGKRPKGQDSYVTHQAKATKIENSKVKGPEAIHFFHHCGVNGIAKSLL